MSDITHINALYDRLFVSINNLYKKQEDIKADKDALTSWSGFLSHNVQEIEKYIKVTTELQEHLDKYEFAKGFRFENMQKKVESLHPLRLELVKMGSEARKLVGFPDRYNSKKSIETCKDLVTVCKEKMSIDETRKVIKLVESNTQKLIELQKLFERDENILRQINDAINADKMTLTKFKAYYDELMQYVSGFPHEGQDEMAVVTNRISLAKKMMALIATTDREIINIKDYCDRYNKGMVVAQYASLVQTMYSTMKYADTKRLVEQLKNVSNQIKTVCKAFENERIELNALKATLQTRSSTIWKEENEKLLETVEGILHRDTTKAIFNLDHLKADYSNSKTKRMSDINDVKHKNPWIESKKRYKKAHEEIISKYIDSTEYTSTINRFKRDRILRIICWCIPIIGWIINIKNNTL